jgi:hypothetical protein
MTHGTSCSPNTRARLLSLVRGFYSVQILPQASQPSDAPLSICMVVPPRETGAKHDIAVAGVLDWQALSARGCFTFVEVRSPNGSVIVNIAGPFAAESDPVAIVVSQINMASGQQQRRRAIPTKIRLRIERLGWRHFSGTDWAKSRNAHLRILEFGLEADNASTPLHAEIMALGAGDRRTGWARVGATAGFAGAEIPLTGFAARLPPTAENRDVNIGYSGEFRAAGMVGPCSNGGICQSPVPDDPLVGISLWIDLSGPEPPDFLEI